jgi:endonuclease YncB( thermonuclease family)
MARNNMFLVDGGTPNFLQGACYYGAMSKNEIKQRILEIRQLFFLSAVLSTTILFWQANANAAAGCCSGHKGVCECACCDGTPLSKSCRSSIIRCQDAASAKLVQKSLSTFSGKVVGVLDGDTIEVFSNGSTLRIRLADIDCPEKGQPFGQKAKLFTSDLSMGKTVEVKVRAVDRYGRSVADVILPSNDSLNGAILKAGLAWWYRDYSKDNRLGILENEARKARRGLWADAKPIPPWVFRRHPRK